MKPLNAILFENMCACSVPVKKYDTDQGVISGCIKHKNKTLHEVPGNSGITELISY
jgi:hypothetical protein